MIELDQDAEPLFLRKRRIEVGSRNVITDAMQILLKNERNNGREDVYSVIENVFNPEGAFKGHLYFTDADDLIREIKLRLAEKDKN